MTVVQITQAEIDDLVADAQNKIDRIIELLKLHQQKFNIYTDEFNQYMNGRKNHILQKVNQINTSLSTCNPDPLFVAEAMEDHLPKFFWKKDKLIKLHNFLDQSEADLAPTVIRSSLHNLAYAIFQMLGAMLSLNKFFD